MLSNFVIPVFILRILHFFFFFCVCIVASFTVQQQRTTTIKEMKNCYKFVDCCKNKIISYIADTKEQIYYSGNFFTVCGQNCLVYMILMLCAMFRTMSHYYLYKHGHKHKLNGMSPTKTNGIFLYKSHGRCI